MTMETIISAPRWGRLDIDLRPATDIGEAFRELQSTWRSYERNSVLALFPGQLDRMLSSDLRFTVFAPELAFIGLRKKEALSIAVLTFTPVSGAELDRAMESWRTGEIEKNQNS
jgi:hypothetical protein